MEWLFILFVAVLVLGAPLAVAAVSMKVVPFNRRLLVERFGRFHAVMGPGMVLLVPFVDRATVVDLDARLPGWRELTAREVAERLAQQHHDPEVAVRPQMTPRPAPKMVELDEPLAADTAASRSDARDAARALVLAGKIDEAVKVLRDSGHGLRDARKIVEQIGKT